MRWNNISKKNLKKTVSDTPKQTFEELALPCYDRLYRSAWYHTGNQEDAQDLVQDVFTIAYRSFSQFKGDSSFFTWLYGIYRNLLFQYRRGKKMYVNRFGSLEENNIALDALISKDNPEIFLRNTQDRLRTHRAVMKLPEKYKEIIFLRHFEEFTYEEIAKILKIRIGTVKSRIHKARKILRKYLG